MALNKDFLNLNSFKNRCGYNEHHYFINLELTWSFIKMDIKQHCF